MTAKYLLVQGNKNNFVKAMEEGFFHTWTEENLKNAFAFGNGTLKDFKRFAKDNILNSTHINLETMTFIDNDKPVNISKDFIEKCFQKWQVI